jgi:hypothetical protein
MDEEADPGARERKRRNIAIAIVLIGFVALFFVMTIVKLYIRFGH